MLLRATLALALLCPLSAHAADVPCPPKSYACWEARLAFNYFGVKRVVAKAKACGWTHEEIAEARQCLKEGQP